MLVVLYHSLVVYQLVNDSHHNPIQMLHSYVQVQVEMYADSVISVREFDVVCVCV